MGKEMKIGDTTLEWIDGEYGRYLKLSRDNRWVNISQASWTKMIGASEAIEGLIHSENGGIFPINERDELEVRDYKGKRYACLKFERIGKDTKSYINRMNFIIEDWKKMMVDATTMNKRKTTSSAPKKTLKKRKSNVAVNVSTSSYPVTVRQYAWQYEGETSPYWYFTEEQCRKSVDFIKDVSIITQDVPSPNIMDLFNMITTYLITDEIKALLTKKCFGCLIDHPSQMQHMTGCMTEWDEAVSHHLEEASKSVTVDKVMKSFIQIMAILGLPTDDMVTPTQVYVEPDHISQQTIPDEYLVLFKNVLC